MQVWRERLGWQQAGHQAKRDRKYSGLSDIVSYHCLFRRRPPKKLWCPRCWKKPSGCSHHYHHLGHTGTVSQVSPSMSRALPFIHPSVPQEGWEPAFLMLLGKSLTCRVCSLPVNSGKPCTHANGQSDAENRPEQLYPDDAPFVSPEEPPRRESSVVIIDPLYSSILKSWLRICCPSPLPCICPLQAGGNRSALSGVISCSFCFGPLHGGLLGPWPGFTMPAFVYAHSRFVFSFLLGCASFQHPPTLSAWKNKTGISSP